MLSDSHYLLIMLLIRYKSTPIYMHKLTGKYHILPHIFEDVFFRTSPAAEPLLLNTVMQIAVCDSRPSFLERLLNIVNNPLHLRHLQKQQGEREKETESGDRRQREVQLDAEACAVWQGERDRGTGELQYVITKFSIQTFTIFVLPQSLAHKIVASHKDNVTLTFPLKNLNQSSNCTQATPQAMW